MAGADIVTVKELLGHKSLEMTLRYSHLSPKFKHAAVELLCKKADTFWTLQENCPGVEESAKNVITYKNNRLHESISKEEGICPDILNGQG
jgi:hypothetical protein